MSIKSDTLAILADALAPIPVLPVPIDPLTRKEFPAVSVVIPRTTRRQKSHDHWYAVEGEFELTVMVAQPVGFDEALDELVQRTILALMESPEWDLNFEQTPSITDERVYMPAGETNIAASRLTFTAQWSERFILDLPDRRIDTLQLVIEPVIDGVVATPMTVPLTNLDTGVPVPLDEIENVDNIPGPERPPDQIPVE